MQKFFLTLLGAAAVVTLAAAPLSFEQLRSNSATAEQIAAIRSSKLVYQVFSQGNPAAKLVIRAQRPATLRFDVISSEDSYAACHTEKNAWGYTKKDGFYDLNKDEIALMHMDADFLPIPIDKKPAFADPVEKGEEEAVGVLCRRYETYSLNDKNLKITLWVEKSTSLLRKVDAEDNDSKTTTIFRDYKTIGGIKLATNIYVSDSDGFHQMTLQSATWNPVFNEKLFVKPSSAEKLEVAPTKTPAAYTAVAAPRRKANPNEIAKLEKSIAKLEIQIKDDENKLDVLGKIIGADREQITALASVSTPVRYRSYWSRSGFIVRSNRPSGRRTRHRQINKLNREVQKAMSSYKAINRDLVRRQIQLAEAKAQLEQITGK